MNGLFDLSRVRPEFRGYFINVYSGLVFSTKRGPLKQLQGYIPAEHGKTETARCYTLGGLTIKGSDLLARAKEHRDPLQKPGAAAVAQPLDVAKKSFAEALGLRPSTKVASPPIIIREELSAPKEQFLSHVERRGFIIGKLSEDGSEVLFGRRPEVLYDTAAVKTKMEELARVTPGTVYVCAKFVGAVKIGETIWK